MSEQFKSVLFRFAKGFVLGGLGSLTTAITQIPAEDLGKTETLVSLCVAFLSGALLALDKLRRL